MSDMPVRTRGNKPSRLDTRLTPEQQAKVIEARRRGFSYERIARAVSGEIGERVSSGSVRLWLIAKGHA